MRIRTLSFAVSRPPVVLVCLLLAACSHKEQISTSITPAQEAAFAQAAENAVLAAGMTSSDRRATMRVLHVTEKLDNAAGKQFVARLVMAQPVQTAMPVPADRIVITEQMVAAVASDDQLASVIAHQMGHLAAGHAFQKLKQAETSKGKTGLLVLANWQPGGTDAAQQLEVQQLAAKLWELRYTPEEERQAGEYGSALTAKAGYKAVSIESLYSALAAQGEKLKRTPEYLAMHPQK